jgi:hypothetical protein
MCLFRIYENENNFEHSVHNVGSSVSSEHILKYIENSVCNIFIAPDILFLSILRGYGGNSISGLISFSSIYMD